MIVAFAGLGAGTAQAKGSGASDKSAAEKLVLTEADVGSDYALEAVGGPFGGGAPFLAEFSQCIGKPVPEPVSTAQFLGSIFFSGGPEAHQASDVNEARILSRVSIVKTKAMAAAAAAVYSDPKFGNCFAQSWEEGAESVTAKTVPVKSYGSFRTAVQVSYIAQTSFGPTPQTVVGVWIRKGRAVIEAFFITSGFAPGLGPAETSVPAFDQTQMDAMLDKLKPRLKSAPK